NMMPKAGPFKNISKIDVDDTKIFHFEAIINSMTPAERDNPKMINGSRRSRIARGSGCPVSEVNQLLKQFSEMKKMMKKSAFQKILSQFPG
ncbi:MAG: signal recognition particle protein, partial [Candidatus Aminicenantes bacterium]|nr:signal recognition particle protein [Candidatus Aminicenantes bacterium]